MYGKILLENRHKHLLEVILLGELFTAGIVLNVECH